MRKRPRRKRSRPRSGAANTGRNKGNVKLNHVPQTAHARRRPARAAAAGAVSGARLVEFVALQSYDLTVPGKGEYSMMNVFARYGYDVWTMDHDGYGNSDSSGNNSDIASGVEDLKAAMTVVTQETGQQKIHFYGTSSGGIRAGGLCAGAAGARRSADPLRLHLQGQRRGGNRAAAKAHRRTARQSAAQARRRYDPLDLHPRRPSQHLRPGGDRKRSSPPR